MATSDISKKLKQQFEHRIVAIDNLHEIPDNTYMVYLLLFNGKSIVLGHGRKNRARVVCDNLTQITPNHIKAIFVRLYHLYGNGTLEKYIIPTKDKIEAQEIEKLLHNEIGGNTREITQEIRAKLFEDIIPGSNVKLLIEIALRSSFDGISDLKSWRKAGLILDDEWTTISNKLKL